MIFYAIVGYGNLGRAVDELSTQFKDCKCVGIFTRRNPKILTSKNGIKIFSIDRLPFFKDKIDVLILCGGSSSDLPNSAREYIKGFNTIDAYDNHNKLVEYQGALNSLAKSEKKVALVGVGWDPGVFSLMRTYFGTFIKKGGTYSFWGKGVSQGHSEALRGIDGVSLAVQYTIPFNRKIKLARAGRLKSYDNKSCHKRLCYIVPVKGYSKTKIKDRIKNIPDYFSGYKTKIRFISEKAFNKKHNNFYHGGYLLRNGETSMGKRVDMEFSVKMDSNPEFTASILLCYIKSVYRLYVEERYGAYNVLDIPISYLLDDKTNITL